MGASLSMAINTTRDELERISGAIEELGQQDDWPDDLVFRVNLVLEELILNIMDYGQDGEDPDISLEIESEDNSISIELSDRGRPFDPLTEAPEPDLTASVGERRVGGLGVHLTKTLMDDVQYTHEGGRNRLSIVTRKVR
ncbi:MAG: ATP-binding protein [Dehalococcoidia bacterium]|nr:ATP-binding protein [Dehalococcoidia bacterium]MXY88253.1 ATP-binding protein [Dehalococcoidia bacterium]MXZ88642.1 ATP-binding protein [Dehalococcoidia bacterium]MYA54414.1 ATP-binding protein [Dehalococcoidia bacterium]MYH67850.1 ATP-binding protein [Dehalococcoidia bacterium]